MAKTISAEDRALEELLETIKTEDLDVQSERIVRAYEFAKKAHAGQFRMSGEPYVCHPVETAKVLAKLQVDEDTIIAGMLHDVPEDTEYTVEDVEKRFGKHVAQLVYALTKLSKVYYKHSMDDRQVQSLRKMFLETANDVRVVIVKLADRLHNMRTLQYLRPDKQQRIAKETLEIFAPLANIYGIFQLRRQLEDLCFAYLQPEEYARIEAFVHDHEKKRKHFVNDTIQVLKKAVKKAGIEAEFQGRPKHYYSIYQKMVRDKKVLQDIFDYFAIRIILKDKESCYQTLGVVHETFKPKPRRFKDYIALPKPNGYQSLHTTVIGLRGKLTEIQIRTDDMHKDAEFGAAAHIVYKDSANEFLSENIAQLRRHENPENFIRGLHDDLLQDRIYVFSPTGKIINLPAGATCLDYIFAVDLPVGKRVFRAIVNNKNYSLIGELQSGDRVEIIYGKKEQSGPERWWLGHVKTSKAKKDIKEYFKKQSLKEKVEMGEKLLQQELDHENQGLIYQLPQKKIKVAIGHFKVKTFEDLIAKIGEGTVEANDVYRIMFPTIQIGPFAKLYRWTHSLRKKIRLGDDEYKYRIRILIEAYDRVGLIREIVQPFYDLNIPIIRFKGTGYDVEFEQGMQSMRQPNVVMSTEHISRDVLDILIEDHEQLIALFDRIEKIPGIVRVQRFYRRRQVAFVGLSALTAAYFLGHPFVIIFLQKTALFSRPFWSSAIIYIGLLGLFGLFFWLRSMGNKTFPHFEDTKWFWPSSFALSVLAILTLFVDDAVFDLNLQRPIMIGLSFLIFVFLYFSYRAHLRRRTRHLSRLRSSRMKALENQGSE